MPTEPLFPDPCGAESPAVRAVASLLDAAQAVRLYGILHPVTVQALSRSFEGLQAALENGSLRISWGRSGMSVDDCPVPADDPSRGRMSNAISETGIRELTLSRGLTLEELQALCSALALAPDEVRRRGGISTVIDASGCRHAAVISDTAPSDQEQARLQEAAGNGHTADAPSAERRISAGGFDLSLGLVLRDPAAAGESIAAFALSRRGKDQDPAQVAAGIVVRAAREIAAEGGGSGPLMKALGAAAAAADNRLGGGLRGLIVREAARVSVAAAGEQARLSLEPDSAMERLSVPRFSETGDDLAGLLRELAVLRGPEGQQACLPVIVRPDVAKAIASRLAVSEADLDSLEAAAGEAAQPTGAETPWVLAETLTVFARQERIGEGTARALEGLIQRLTSLLTEALRGRHYSEAATIVAALSEATGNSAIRPTARRALGTLCDRNILGALVADLEYLDGRDGRRRTIMDLLARITSEVTPVLLEMLAAEPERSVRMTLVKVLKELGRGQIALLGERLSEERWYFVRNIVTILGESRKEEAVAYLKEAGGHRNFQVRQEVVKALVAIGGRQAADLLVRFLRDPDIDIRFMALRGIGSLGIGGPEQEQALIRFIRGSWFRRPDPELQREAVVALGSVGSSEAAAFLSSFLKRRTVAAAAGEYGAIAAAARDSLARIIGRQRSHD